jgi:hypothetical protein
MRRLWELRYLREPTQDKKKISDGVKLHEEIEKGIKDGPRRTTNA